MNNKKSKGPISADKQQLLARKKKLLEPWHSLASKLYIHGAQTPNYMQTELQKRCRVWESLLHDVAVLLGEKTDDDREIIILSESDTVTKGSPSRSTSTQIRKKHSGNKKTQRRRYDLRSQTSRSRSLGSRTTTMVIEKPIPREIRCEECGHKAWNETCTSAHCRAPSQFQQFEGCIKIHEEKQRDCVNEYVAQQTVSEQKKMRDQSHLLIYASPVSSLSMSTQEIVQQKHVGDKSMLNPLTIPKIYKEEYGLKSTPTLITQCVGKAEISKADGTDMHKPLHVTLCPTPPSTSHCMLSQVHKFY